jgi:hypothetical protein
MKLTLKRSILAFSLTVASTVCAQKTAPPFSLSLRSRESVMRAGSQVRVEIAQTNASDRELPVVGSNLPDRAESHYFIDVRDAKGRSVPDTEYAHTVPNKNAKPATEFGFSEVVYSLKPGESLTEVVVITKLYDLGQPGRYTVQVSREIPRELGGGTVKSNVITIKVTK